MVGIGSMVALATRFLAEPRKDFPMRWSGSELDGRRCPEERLRLLATGGNRRGIAVCLAVFGVVAKRVYQDIDVGDFQRDSIRSRRSAVSSRSTPGSKPVPRDALTLKGLAFCWLFAVIPRGGGSRMKSKDPCP